ncbi:MAG: hypothetical protein D6702_09290 [Planctomycetota bacterium]|nr:MAG: hypothetical protein D6702_09290 [Planctomycetota bacterium]
MAASPPISAFLLPVVLVGLPACVQLVSPTAPEPTEHRLDEGAEARNKSARREWIEGMHLAPPGVDWREVERANGLAAMGRRNAIVTGRAAAAAAGTWRELGSRNQAGRMYAAAWSSDGQSLYAGSALGGVWIGGRDGSNWTPIGDNLYGGAHDLVVVTGPPGAPDIVLRHAGGMVHRSADQGLTWTEPAGLAAVSQVARLLALPDHTILLVGYDTNALYGWGVYRSVDRGLSFTRTFDMKTWKSDLWAPRDTLGSVFVFKKDKLYESTDGGRTFVQVGNPLPFQAGDVRLRGSEHPSLVLSLAAKNGTTWQIWRSFDHGTSWNHVHDCTDFWGAFECSSQDPNLLAYGGVEMRVSRDGGATFSVVNPWGAYYGNPAIYLHADIMRILCLPDANAPQGEVWYIGTDGGLYHSLDRLQSVANLSLTGLGVSQYYSTLTSRRRPDLVMAGAQDQGFQRAQLGAPGGGGGPWADFAQLISGDYGHLSCYNGTHDFVFAPYPGFVLVSDNETSPNLITSGDLNFPAGLDHLWLPPVVADPDARAACFLAARDSIWRCKRTGYWNWTWSQWSTTSFGGRMVSALAFSPLDSSRAWAACTDGTLWRSLDHGVTWSMSQGGGPGSHYFYGTSLWPSTTNVDEVWVGGSGYGAPPVMRSLDGGVSWQARRNGLPNTLVYDLCEAPGGGGQMFCGTENGAWMYDPATGQWQDILGATAPITIYWSVEPVWAEGIVRFGTYGRGIWDYLLDLPGAFPYGELRGDANVLTLRGAGVPRIGANYSVTIAGAVPNAAGKLVVAAAADDRPYLGGTLLVNGAGARLWSFTAGPQGEATLTAAVPNDGGLVGREFFLQAFAPDAGQAQGWALSHGLRLRIGP